MPAPTGNGWLRQQLNLSTIVPILVLLGTLVLWSGTVKAHMADANVHHTQGQLDAAYMRQDVAAAKLDALTKEVGELRMELRDHRREAARR